MKAQNDILKIKKIVAWSFVSLFLIGILAFFIFHIEIALAIIMSEALTFLVFVFTLFFYYWVNKKKPGKLLGYVFFSFLGKIMFLAMAFYAVYILNFVNLTVFAVSFVIFFTIFLNMEIFLIYKKILFSK